MERNGFMVFSSMIFIYAFLPLQMLLYHLVPEKYKNAVLLIFSLIFYSWSGPVYLLILVFEAFVSYLAAVLIDDIPEWSGKIFTALCTVLLCVLVFFKYLNLLSEAVNGILGIIPPLSSVRVPRWNIVLPIGISFYTFQLLSYVADVYRKRVKSNKHFWKVLLYASLFHQCIAGPIVRYETVCNEIDHREVSLDDLFEGIRRFCIGLFKKAVLANGVAAVADSAYGLGLETLKGQTVSGLWILAVFYTLQIYLDFSAYSDMAIGMGRMVGFHYLENFNYPYIANSVQEFWRRWHISLSSFFRDYVYIPLGGSRVKPLRHILNLMIVWCLTGLWHGAAVNFILWGFYYFLLLVAEKYILRGKRVPVAGHVYTIFFVIMGWVIFRFDKADELFAALSGMFGLSGNPLWSLQDRSLLVGNCFLFAAAVIACTPLMGIIFAKAEEKGIGKVLNVLVPAACLVLSTLALIGNSYNPFLYFRF